MNGRRMRLRLWWLSMRERLRSLIAAAPPPIPPALPPMVGRGVLDARSYDLGDKTGWRSRDSVYSRFTDIQKAIVQDSILLRGAFLPETLARQGGYTLEPGGGDGLSGRMARRALREVEAFLSGVRTPLGEGFDELFYQSVGELSRYSNFTVELIWQGNRLVGLQALPVYSMVLLVDNNGYPERWAQFNYYLRPTYFELWEICHGVMQRQAGDRYGTPSLEPCVGNDGDLDAYRAIEAMAGQQLQHMIFPTRLIKFGTEQYPETSENRIEEQKQRVEDMYREGYLVGSGRESLESDAPTPFDPAPLIEHFKKRVAQATSFSLTRLGEADSVTLANAEVMAHNEHMDQMGRTLAAADSWRRGVFVPYLASLGIPAAFAPYIVPGEPDPVRRQKKGKHAADLHTSGILTRDEARLANGYNSLSEEQSAQVDKEQGREGEPEEPEEPDSEPGENDEEPEEGREERAEERRA